ncbi:MAG TPA: pilus assembly protein TadG-related protein [Pyrinomonadaceae bacterium]|nr:pilus assembly protein TadG-related protein [Pyrinomonadaceae bacterium]
MSAKNGQRARLRSGERGSIIIMTAFFMLLLFLMLGLCIDVSRIYMVRAELQNAADAAALSAAREFNAGTTGIDNAVTRATSIINTQGFAQLGVTIERIEFSVNADGPNWLAAADAKALGTVGNIKYVRVTTQAASTAILFGLQALGSSHVESRNAVAGISVGINGFCDYYPIALAKTNPTVPFAVNTPLAIHFVDNTGTTINLPNEHYTILDTPWVTGNGADETRDAVAGVAPRCANLGDVLAFSKTASANAVNGPKQIAGGTNTRFYEYPPGNQLTYANAKPATNIFGSNAGETMTFTQYDNGDQTTYRAPGQAGIFERRLLLLPIIAPIVNGTTEGDVKDFGYFFIRQRIEGDCPKKVKGVDVPCPPGTTLPGDILIEYLGKDFVVARGIFDPTECSSNLGVSVLYR